MALEFHDPLEEPLRELDEVSESETPGSDEGRRKKDEDSRQPDWGRVETVLLSLTILFSAMTVAILLVTFGVI